MSDYRSPIGKIIPEKIDVEAVKSAGYWHDGILVIDMKHDDMDFVERELFTRWAERRYKRKDIA